MPVNVRLSGARPFLISRLAMTGSQITKLPAASVARSSTRALCAVFNFTARTVMLGLAGLMGISVLMGAVTSPLGLSHSNWQLVLLEVSFTPATPLPLSVRVTGTYTRVGLATTTAPTEQPGGVVSGPAWEYLIVA